MDQLQKINAAISNGLSFLKNAQNKDGGYDSFSSSSLAGFQKDFAYQTTFVPALVLAATAKVDHPLSKTITPRLAKYVLAQRSSHWSFNYWSQSSPERKSHPYPDDLDDTFCALSAMALYDIKSITPEVLANAVRLLLAAESQVGGPYRTWLTTPSSDKVWQDVDLAVNSNVSYFLSLVSQALPNVTTYIDGAILRKKISSPYYPFPHPIIYFISRSYVGKRTKMLDKIIDELSSAQLSPLKSALLLSSSVRLKNPIKLDVLINNILSTQQDNGAWAAEAFCCDPMRNGKKFYHGAEALTTAFAIEALWLYSSSIKSKSLSYALPDKIKGSFKSQLSRVLKLQNQTLLTPLRPAISEKLSLLIKSSNGQEIAALPYLFSKSLRKPPKKVGDSEIAKLSLANLYGWVAYTIYDDLIDEEGQTNLIPIANTAMRKSLMIFYETTSSEAFKNFVLKIFDNIDNANAWELANCRFKISDKWIYIDKLPPYGRLAKLAERSFGHALAPLGVLAMQDISPDSREFSLIQAAMEHYLIARQINDDAHDWQTDLKNGHVTWVVSEILKGANIKPGRHSLTSLTLKLQKQFWHHTLPHICQEILRHTKAGRQAATKSGLLKPSNIIENELDGIDKSVKETLSAQHDATNFLRHYQTAPAEKSSQGERR